MGSKKIESYIFILVAKVKNLKIQRLPGGGNPGEHIGFSKAW